MAILFKPSFLPFTNSGNYFQLHGQEIAPGSNSSWFLGSCYTLPTSPVQYEWLSSKARLVAHNQHKKRLDNKSSSSRLLCDGEGTTLSTTSWRRFCVVVVVQPFVASMEKRGVVGLKNSKVAAHRDGSSTSMSHNERRAVGRHQLPQLVPTARHPDFDFGVVRQPENAGTNVIFPKLKHTHVRTHS